MTSLLEWMLDQVQLLSYTEALVLGKNKKVSSVISILQGMTYNDLQ